MYWVCFPDGEQDGKAAQTLTGRCCCHQSLIYITLSAAAQTGMFRLNSGHGLGCTVTWPPLWCLTIELCLHLTGCARLRVFCVSSLLHWAVTGESLHLNTTSVVKVTGKLFFIAPAGRFVTKAESLWTLAWVFFFTFLLLCISIRILCCWDPLVELSTHSPVKEI